MVQDNQQYQVVRTFPRIGELYAVTDRRTGLTTIRKAERNFRRDRRRVFVPVLTDEVVE